MNDKTSYLQEAELVKQLLIAEYNALRREIELLIEHQKDIVNFSILAFVAMVGLPGVITKIQDTEPGNIPELFLYVYLAFPSIFFLLALLYADKSARILRAAHYIHSDLRKKAIQICNCENIWRWEFYKSGEKSLRRTTAKWLDMIRWFIFIFPSFISIVLFFALPSEVKSIVDIKTIIILLIAYAHVSAFILYLGWKLEETSPFNDEKS